jgi:hypothetical protein
MVDAVDWNNFPNVCLMCCICCIFSALYNSSRVCSVEKLWMDTEVAMDLNRNAFRIVQSLTEEKKPNPRSVVARAAGKLGGPARAKRLTSVERREIATKASLARWHKSA